MQLCRHLWCSLFVRTTSGFWVWRTEKSEGVNGYEAKVKPVLKISWKCLFGVEVDSVSFVYMMFYWGTLFLTCDSAWVLSLYFCKVYMANNVNVVTRIRTEHLTEEEKRRYKGIFP